MKRIENLSRLRKSSLADLRKEVTEIEKKLQTQVMAIKFGKSKEVRTIRALKLQLAQTLTIANEKLRSTETEGSEK